MELPLDLEVTGSLPINQDCHPLRRRRGTDSSISAECLPAASEASSSSGSSEHVQPAGVEIEKAKTTTLQGKLKSKPSEGRPDARGNTTAWARFAAHEEDRDGAHLYSTTFHKHTAGIALSLDNNAPLTVQGYLHEQDDPGSRRLDTLSVINVIDYPGKPTE